MKRQPVSPGDAVTVERQRRRILLDTNVWRYVVEREELETVHTAAKSSRAVVLACPAVLYEMLRLRDLPLQRRLVKAICRSRWVRMMPEAYEESMEFLAEVRRLRPHWLVTSPDVDRFRLLSNDWKGPRGLWYRARSAPQQTARVLEAVEGEYIHLARADATRRREQMREVVTYERVMLSKWTTTFPLHPPGWKGDKVETWRATTLTFYVEALFAPGGRQADATREWLEPWLDLAEVRRSLGSLTRLILYESDPSHLPRNWLRWALGTLQATRRSTPGTPVDNQIGSYLVDADVLVTADKAFAAAIGRLRDEGTVPVAEARLVTAADAADVLTNLLRQG